MRLLLIVHDARFRALIRHHVSCQWPDATLTMRTSHNARAMPPEFLAQGFDAVIIDQAWLGGQGLGWLQDLGSRPGFAPIVFLAERVDDEVARRARIFGAFAVLARQGFSHHTLIGVIDEASRVQQRAQADWRVSPEAEQSRRFGAVRIPGYRWCVALQARSRSCIRGSEKAGR